MDRLHDIAENVVAAGTVPHLTRVVEAPIAVHAVGAESGLLAMGKFSSLPLLLDSIRKDAESSGHSNGNRFLFLVPHAEVLRIETAEGRATTLVVAVREVSRDPDVPGMVHASCGSGCRVARWCASPVTPSIRPGWR